MNLLIFWTCSSEYVDFYLPVDKNKCVEKCAVVGSDQRCRMKRKFKGADNGTRAQEPPNCSGANLLSYIPSPLSGDVLWESVSTLVRVTYIFCGGDGCAFSSDVRYLTHYMPLVSSLRHRL